ncbi:TrmH family RNA methyltransferase [Mycoplasma hafezii]|uniref:TrmH family RNA methyltransferase n=1 Tax=Mycoplasma hafezii TaxID=525886 RepID=UPI003CEE5B34
MILVSKNNPKVKFWKKLKEKKYRDIEGLYLIESYHLVEEAKKYGIVVETIETEENQKYSDSTLVSKEIISLLASTVTPQQIIAVVKKDKPLSQSINKVIALNNLQDPGNVGTIIRLAKAFDFDTVIIENLDPYNDKVIRSSQGAFFDTNIIQTKNLNQTLIDLKNDNFTVYETLLNEKAQALNDVQFKENKIIIVVGNEGQGISKDIQKLSDTDIYIPISFESLNVACATAIILDKIRNK